MPLPVMSNALTVDRLEHRGAAAFRVDIPGGSDAQRTGQGGGQIGQDVGVQVGRDNSIDRPGLANHPHSHRVDQFLVPCHVFVVMD